MSTLKSDPSHIPSSIAELVRYLRDHHNEGLAVHGILVPPVWMSRESEQLAESQIISLFLSKLDSHDPVAIKEFLTHLEQLEEIEVITAPDRVSLEAVLGIAA